MEWKIPAIGIGTIGAGAGLYWLLRPKRALVIYSDDPQDPQRDRSTFVSTAQAAGRLLRTEPVAVRSAADLVSAVRNAPSNLGTVVFVGHGTATKFLSPARFGIRTRERGGTALPRWISPEDFAREIAPKLSRGTTIALAGCSAARGPREPRGWVVETGWHGGAQSLAGRIRDTLAVRGVSGIVRGHTVTGTTLANPQGRTFEIKRSMIRRPGVHAMAEAGLPGPPNFAAYRSWNTRARGARAARWLLGGSIGRG
jgi:hypothetical protein